MTSCWEVGSWSHKVFSNMLRKAASWKTAKNGQVAMNFLWTNNTKLVSLELNHCLLQQRPGADMRYFQSSACNICHFYILVDFENLLCFVNMSLSRTCRFHSARYKCSCPIFYTRMSEMELVTFWFFSLNTCHRFGRTDIPWLKFRWARPLCVALAREAVSLLISAWA